MKINWKDEDISRVLRKGNSTGPDPVVFSRTWAKIDGRLSERNRSLWHHFIWRPWGHPIRWVMAVGCLSVVFSGVLYRQNSVDRAELASYVLSVSNPTASMTNDLGIVREPALLAGSSRADSRDILLDEDRNDSLSGDELFL